MSKKSKNVQVAAADRYITWLHEACTPHHAVAATVAVLQANGFAQRDYAMICRQRRARSST